VESEIYALKSVTMRVSSLMGSGPKKQECQDTCCMLENLGNDTYFFAVYDGHGSSGREASQTANDYISSEL
jgi:integrin-linked kinase-associated serine/threonine phosphatase 2C